ncbi:trypsin-like peptidase domain-containing protein [Brachymonas sp. G13]|uniref:S1C family serine protease n=1 Tax=Brachymonas wangyanguii TaxID=3130163 RepID=UPI0016920CD7|nr:trypsin-like serine protease [Ramlibacter sp.]
MKRFWLLFSQVVTVALALFLVVAAVRPDWVSRTGDYKSVTVIEAPARDKPVPSAQTETLRTAAQKAAPSVVSILTNPDERQAAPSLSAPGDGNSEEDLFSGVGSGVIVSPSGYILTNNHVVEGATTIEVLLHDGRRTMARIIGTDPDTDLAVLQTEIKELPAITLGDSESLQVGDPVLAIGNPFGVGQTVTSGIVSALGRSQLGINTFENFIQTDAAINPGNSGGALVDIHGNLVGINTAIYSRTGGYMGIGFATPTSTAKHVLDSIVTNGHVTRGWIGVEPNDITPEIAETFKAKANQGVIITGIVQGGPASLAQMRPGDIITAVNGKPIRNVQEVLSAVAALTPGVAASFTVLREGQTQPIELVPAQRPRPEAQQPGQR